MKELEGTCLFFLLQHQISHCTQQIFWVLFCFYVLFVNPIHFSKTERQRKKNEGGDGLQLLGDTQIKRWLLYKIALLCFNPISVCRVSVLCSDEYNLFAQQKVGEANSRKPLVIPLLPRQINCYLGNNLFIIISQLQSNWVLQTLERSFVKWNILTRNHGFKIPLCH